MRTAILGVLEFNSKSRKKINVLQRNMLADGGLASLEQMLMFIVVFSFRVGKGGSQYQRGVSGDPCRPSLSC